MPDHSTLFDHLRKRTVLLGGMVLASGLAFAQAQDTQATPVQVLYWSAADCGPCRLWREGDRYKEFKEQADRLGVALVSVRKPSLKDPATAFEWPDNASLYRQLHASIAPPRVVPNFDILCRGKPVHRMTGLGEWDSFWHSRLRQAVRDCQAVQG